MSPASVRTRLRVCSIELAGDALSIFDQVTSFTRGNITYQQVIENLNVLDYQYYFRLTNYLLKGQVKESLLLLNEVLNKGFDAGNFITGLGSHFRDVLVSKDEQTTSLLEVGASIRQRYKEQARSCPLPFLYKAMKLCNECDLTYRLSKNKRFLVELTLIQLAQLSEDSESPSGGLGPKTTLKPLFTKQAATEPQPATPAAQVPQTPFHKQVGSSISSPQGMSSTPAKNEVQPTSPQPKAATTAGTKAQLFEEMQISIKHWNISDAPSASDHQDDKAANLQTLEHQPLNEETLKSKWASFANQLPQEQVAMTKKMQNALLEVAPEDVVQIGVDNALAANEFQAIMPDLQAYLQKELHNGYLTLNIVVNESDEHTQAYTKTERFEQMAQENPVLLELKDEFALEFST